MGAEGRWVCVAAQRLVRGGRGTVDGGRLRESRQSASLRQIGKYECGSGEAFDYSRSGGGCAVVRGPSLIVDVVKDGSLGSLCFTSVPQTLIVAVFFRDVALFL